MTFDQAKLQIQRNIIIQVHVSENFRRNMLSQSHSSTSGGRLSSMMYTV